MLTTEEFRPYAEILVATKGHCTDNCPDLYCPRCPLHEACSCFTSTGHGSVLIYEAALEWLQQNPKESVKEYKTYGQPLFPVWQRLYTMIDMIYTEEGITAETYTQMTEHTLARLKDLCEEHDMRLAEKGDK